MREDGTDEVSEAGRDRGSGWGNREGDRQRD